MRSVSTERAKANDFVKQILAQLLPNGAPSDDSAPNALCLWGFMRNTNRVNVLPEGESWVYSDTLGLVMKRASQSPGIPNATVDHDAFFQLLSRWMRSRQPETCALAPCHTPRCCSTLDMRQRGIAMSTMRDLL